VEAADAGRRVILVRAETSPEDVHGMGRAAGVLTASGGFVSHAAVVARGWGIPAVVGARAIHVGNRAITIGDRQLSEGETITIDGSTGEVFAGGQGSSGAAVVPEVETLLSWAAELGIVANRRAEPTGDDVVRTLLVKGQTTVENLAQMLLADPAFVEALLAGAIVDGAVEQRGGDFRLTADGKLKAGELIAVEREMWGAGNSAAALEAFVPFDHRMKAAVTAWQMKSAEAFNDHADPEYDAGVLAELGALHSDTSQWLAALSGGLPRLDDYRVRLGRALELARGGNQMYVASPRVESYHTVWFELHEDLIRISGRKRADEVAAGRA
jgi:pyruvate,orthophosphate dikinase